MRRIMIGFILGVAMSLSAGVSFASPGLMQLAVRSGFWSNQFPDTAIMLQHLYYNTYDKQWDSKGKKVDSAFGKVKVAADFVRLIRPWHFGEGNQYQVILEEIIPFVNASWTAGAGGSQSGIMDPMLYASIGWNNPDKSTHVQGALVIRAPFGDKAIADGVSLLATDAWGYQPLVAVQQKITDTFRFDGSASYQIETEKLDGSKSKGKNYLELNGIVSAVLGTTDVFLQADYTAYGKSKTAGVTNKDDGFNTAVAIGVNDWFRPNMQIGIKFEKDIDGENTPASQGFNVRYLWIF